MYVFIKTLTVILLNKNWDKIIKKLKIQLTGTKHWYSQSSMQNVTMVGDKVDPPQVG